MAQVTLTAQLPPAGLVTRDQLWNLVLVNNTNETQDILLYLDLKDEVTGQTVLTAASGSLTMPKGAKMLNARDMQPLQYNISSPDFTGNLLPIGRYIACYRVSRLSLKGTEPLADECLRLNIAPLSPPLLNTPSNGSVSETPYPQFTWLPPAPLDMFSNLAYDILVAEVLDGQSPAEAIHLNQPVYARTNLLKGFDSYPSSMPQLDTGKVYAWQVTAYSGLSYAAQTEIWTFSLGSNKKAEEIIAATPYIRLSQQKSEIGIAPNGHLKMSYYNRYSDKAVTVSILKLSDARRADKAASFTLALKQGENLIDYDLGKLLRYKENELYEAQLKNGKGEVWKMIFKVIRY